MRIDRLQGYFRQHPEEVEPDSAVWASLRRTSREAWRRLFEVPPDVRAAVRMLQVAREDGDVTRGMALATEYLDHEPDALLWPLLEGEFAPDRDSVVPVVVWALRYHRRRLETDPGEWYKARATEVYHSLRKPPQGRLVKALRSYGGSPYARLRTELPGAILRAEGDGFVGHDLVREVEKRIVKDNRRERTVRLPEVLADTTLDSYVGAENASDILDQIINRAGLTPKQREVLSLFRRGMKPKEIAGRRRVAPSTVYELLRRILDALRAAA